MHKLLLAGILIFYMSFSQAQINYDWYTEGVNNNPSHSISFTVNNRLDITLKKEGIMIKRTDLPMQNIAELSVAIIDPKLAGNPEPTVDELRKIGGYLMRKESNGHSIPLQIDDIDKDGIWDELFFLTDLAPREIRQFYIYNGPLRSMVKVTTHNWNTSRGFYELEQNYQVIADKSWATVDVKFTKFLPGDSNIMFGAGIRKIMQEYKSVNTGGTAISMGKDVIVRSPDETLADEGLIVPWEGIAIVIKDQYKPQYHNIKNDGGNHVFTIPLTASLDYQYMVFAGWSFGEVRNNEKEFINYVETEKKKYNTPPIVKIYNYEVKANKKS